MIEYSRQCPNIFFSYKTEWLYIHSTVGWVNLYQKFKFKFKFKNIQFVVNSFYQKNGKTFFYFFGTTGLRICMDLRIFASFLYPTLLKICSQSVHTFHAVKTVQECKKYLKTVKF